MRTEDFTICECTECECHNYVGVYEDDPQDIYICDDCLFDEHAT